MKTYAYSFSFSFFSSKILLRWTQDTVLVTCLAPGELRATNLQHIIKENVNTSTLTGTFAGISCERMLFESFYKCGDNVAVLKTVECFLLGLKRTLESVVSAAGRRRVYTRCSHTARFLMKMSQPGEKSLLILWKRELHCIQHLANNYRNTISSWKRVLVLSVAVTAMC